MGDQFAANTLGLSTILSQCHVTQVDGALHSVFYVCVPLGRID